MAVVNQSMKGNELPVNLAIDNDLGIPIEITTSFSAINRNPSKPPSRTIRPGSVSASKNCPPPAKLVPRPTPWPRSEKSLYTPGSPKNIVMTRPIKSSESAADSKRSCVASTALENIYRTNAKSTIIITSAKIACPFLERFAYLKDVNICTENKSPKNMTAAREPLTIEAMPKASTQIFGIHLLRHKLLPGARRESAKGVAKARNIAFPSVNEKVPVVRTISALRRKTVLSSPSNCLFKNTPGGRKCCKTPRGAMRSKNSKIVFAMQLKSYAVNDTAAAYPNQRYKSQNLAPMIKINGELWLTIVCNKPHIKKITVQINNI